MSSRYTGRFGRSEFLRWTTRRQRSRGPSAVTYWRLPPSPEMQAAVQSLMTYMPPSLLGEPGIYFAVILCFIFVIVVYI